MTDDLRGDGARFFISILLVANQKKPEVDIVPGEQRTGGGQIIEALVFDEGTDVSDDGRLRRNA